MTHSSPYRKTRRVGFTLIELSIGLVIIGLIVGGILVGRDLIRVAEGQKIISEIDKFTSAANTFQLKYNCLPGDCRSATQFFNNTGNGNGDGRIDGSADCTDSSLQIYCNDVQALTATGNMEEVTLFNEHLAKAGLINLPSFNSRTDPVPNVMANHWYVNLGTPASSLNVVANHGQNVLRLTGLQVPEVPYRILFSAAGSLDPVMAFGIDTKIDDGLPMTGTVIHEEGIGSHYMGGDAYGCQTGGLTNAYDVAGTATPSTPLVQPCMLTIFGMFNATP